MRGSLLLVIGLLSLIRLGACRWAFDLEEHVWGKRELLPRYSLGPAPYPMQRLMDWELFGSCYSRDDAIHVTDNVQDQKGALWTRRSMELKEWQADLEFRVGGQKGDFFGDGFGFWLSEERGRGGDALGGPDVWNGLGIFFDTYKNKEFKGKRHPYVYGIVNDGLLDYRKIRSKDINNGCHVPFRMDSDEIATTVARITYRRKTISVIMQPKGAVDWVKCFQMKDVKLPESVFFGVTAMTGQLVDKHHMTEIKVYTGIKMDPWDYAEENDPAQISDMWKAMVHSGDAAREFEDWEQRIHDETEFDLDRQMTREDQIHYYSDEYDDYKEEDDDDEEGEDYEDEEGVEHSPEKKKHKSKFTNAELQSISEIIENTEVGKKMHEIQKAQREKMHGMRTHLESEISETVDRLTSLVRDIRVREHRMNVRISQLASKLRVAIEPLEDEQRSSSGSWIWPFVFFILLLVVISSFGYTRYRAYMKTHLL